MDTNGQSPGDLPRRIKVQICADLSVGKHQGVGLNELACIAKMNFVYSGILIDARHDLYIP
jgi:hypothetical protein